MELQNWSENELAQRCREETENYRRTRAHDTRYCFELVQRAFADKNNTALSMVMDIYEYLVIQWVVRHDYFRKTGEPVDFFVGRAFTQFLLHRSGKGFDGFKTLPAVLMYLKMCVNTVIMEDWRGKAPLMDADELVAVPDYRPPVDDMIMEDLHNHALWRRMAALLPDPNDQLLVNCLWQYDMKQAAICENYPEVWPTPNDVRVALQRVRRTLRKDPSLRNMLGLAPEEN